MSNRGQQITQAVILAAGNGKRLQSSTPKPAHRLLGVPLLARTLLSLEKAGITDAYVVTGYEAAKVRETIERFTRLSLRVHWLHNENWREPNGLSVLAAKEAVSGPFILTMSDHLFDSSIVKTLIEQTSPADAISLAVDRAVDSIFDLDDATKVAVKGDRIDAIGKTLSTYQAIDTGVFLATPALFEALDATHAEGRSSLSDGVQLLAASGRAKVVDVTGKLWQDIDTPEGHAEGERKLLASVRKATDGPIARRINRPISVAISRWLVRTPVSPNMLSVANLGVGLLSAGVATLGGYWNFLISGLLFQLASVLDGVDGEVAKLTLQSTKQGEWIDTACDQLSYVAALVGLLIGVARSDLPPFFLQTGILGLISAVVGIASIMIYLARQRTSGSALSVKYGFQSGTGIISRVMRVMQYLTKRDVMAFVVMMLAIFGLLPWFVVAYGVGMTLMFLPATVMANFNLPGRRQPVLTPVATRAAVSQAASHKSAAPQAGQESAA